MENKKPARVKSRDSKTPDYAQRDAGISRNAPGPGQTQTLINTVIDKAGEPITELEIVRAVMALDSFAETIPIQFRIARMVRDGILLRYYEPKAAKPLYVRTGRA